MTVTADIPQSGIYFQQGAIVQLVAQIIDINTITPTNPSGNPIQLQSATGMTISILYPDGATAQTFVASLYTDGSDGMVAYTTRNNGSTIDLSEVGLYKMQASAVLGGVQLPPSFETDFYVEPNVSGLSASPIFNSSALIMFDVNNVRWAGTISAGALVFAATPMGPSQFLWFNRLSMKDSNGVIWNINVSTAGVQGATQAQGNVQDALSSFILNDVNGRSWVVTVSTAGVLTPA